MKFAILLFTTTVVPLLTAQTQGVPSHALPIPVDTSFLASLTTPVSIDQLKPGDTIEAQTAQDVKQGHTVLLKKGVTLLGHVDLLQSPTSASSERALVVTFDRVKLKNGEEPQLPLIIQALAPKSDAQLDNVEFANGRGVQGALQSAVPAGHSDATRGTVNPVTTSSHGVQDLPGLELRERITNEKHSTVLAASRSGIQLKKGTQLVMKVVTQ
jgi:hypothetical protein